MSKIVEQFEAQFGYTPQVVSRAPGRLEILGNHTDYNQGFVLSCAVEQHACVALGRREGAVARIKDLKLNSERTFNINEVSERGAKDWSNYVKGVVFELQKRGANLGAFDAVLMSTVPLSAGMSSSAALEVSFSFAFKDAFGIDLSLADWARVGQGVENNYMGLNSGLLDQFSSIFGRKNQLILSDFRSVEVLRTVPLPSDYVLVVVNSMVKHNLVDSEYNSRRVDCENAAQKLAVVYPGVKTLRDVSVEQLEQAKSDLTTLEYRRAAHVVGECDRVKRGVKLLDEGDVKSFGQLLFESHESSMNNFENSSPELDYLVELARSIEGCVGARLSGGGFGGITIHLVKHDAAESYAARIKTAFKLYNGADAEVIICSIGDGANVERVKK